MGGVLHKCGLSSNIYSNSQNRQSSYETVKLLAFTHWKKKKKGIFEVTTGKQQETVCI